MSESPPQTPGTDEPSSPDQQPGLVATRWPGGSGDSAAPRKNRARLILLAVLGIGAVILGVMVLTGDDDGANTSSPEGAVRGYSEAMLDQDCLAANEFATGIMVMDEVDCAYEDGSASLVSIETESQEGDRAVVIATIDDGSGPIIANEFAVRRIDSEWKVSDALSVRPVEAP